MICYHCGFSINQIQSMECSFCGTKFGKHCTACGSPNPAMASYCFYCGKAADTGRVVAFQKNNNALSEARKNVAVIFADISGFTRLSERFDPELVREIINDCFAYIVRPVYEYGGSIDKYIGDCVMILFGARESHVDDAKRAVLCSIKMQQLLKEFSELRAKPMGFDLEMSVGIHYGLVVTGRVGSFYDADYTVMGDTVNTAQRIQSQAPKSTVYVSEAVYRETSEDFHYEGPVTFSVKNKEQPITCYIPTASMHTASLLRQKYAFFGREAELLLLKEQFDKACRTAGQVVAVSGPPGIGKTRLVQEFLQSIGDDYKKISVECFAAQAAKPYGAIGSLLLSIMNINPEDPEIVKQSRIISYISFILGELDEEGIKRNYRFLSLLMGMEPDNELKSIIRSMDMNHLQSELFNQFQLFFEGYVKRFKPVIVLENLHWSDSKSLTLLNDLYGKLSGKRIKGILLIYTAREELRNRKENRRKDSFTAIHLRPLSREQVEEAAKHQLHCQELDSRFSDSLQTASNGNPLYLLEYIKYLKRLNRCRMEEGRAYLRESTNELPNSLQGLILSKLNEMDESTVEFIQTASAIGKEFHASFISFILKRNIEADGLLGLPLQLEILQVKTTYATSGRSEKVFSFHHEVEREVYYNSLLLKQKKLLHKRIGEAMEQLFEKSIDSYYDIIAEHFEKAEDKLKAADYYYLSAVRHKTLFSYSSAMEHYLKVLALAQQIKGYANERLLDIHQELCNIYSIMSKHESALQHLSLALELAQDETVNLSLRLVAARIYKDQGRYAEAVNLIAEIEPLLDIKSALYGNLLYLKCNILRVLGRLEEALEAAKKAEKLLKKHKDYENLAKALNAAGILYYSTGKPDMALNCYIKAYESAERSRDLQTLMKTSTNIAVIYHSQGKITQAMTYYNIAKELSGKLSHHQGYVTSITNLGVLYMDRGHFNKARALFNEALPAAMEASMRIVESSLHSNLADAEYYLGNYDAAAEHIRAALSISQEIDDQEGKGINLIALGKIEIELDNTKQARQHLEDALAIMAQLENCDGIYDYHYYSACCDLSEGLLSQAAVHAEEAWGYAVQLGSEKKKAKLQQLKGLIRQQRHDWAGSISLFTSAASAFEKEAAFLDAALSHSYRARSRKALGLDAEARQDQEKARQLIAQIDSCKLTEMIVKEYGIT